MEFEVFNVIWKYNIHCKLPQNILSHFFLIDIKNICKDKYPIQNMPPEDSAVCSRVLWAISGEEAESGSEFES